MALHYTNIIQAIKKGDLAFLQKHTFRDDEIHFLDLFLKLAIEHEQFEVYKYLNYKRSGKYYRAELTVMNELRLAINCDNQDIVNFIIVNSPLSLSQIFHLLEYCELKYIAYILDHVEISKYYVLDLVRCIFRQTLRDQEYGLDYFKSFVAKYKIDLNYVFGLSTYDLLEYAHKEKSVEHLKYLLSVLTNETARKVCIGFIKDLGQ